MKKKLIILPAIALMCLSGCGPTKSSSSSASKESSSKSSEQESSSSEKTVASIVLDAEHCVISTQNAVGSYNVGDVVNFKVVAEENYELSEVKVNGTTVNKGEGEFPYSFTAVETNTITAKAALKEAHITEQFQNCTVTYDKESYKVGETVSFTVTPTRGFEVSEVKLNGEALTAEEETYTFIAGADDILFVKAVPSDVLVTVTGDEHCTLSYKKEGCKFGETVMFKLIFDEHPEYEINSVTINGEVKTADVEGYYSFVADLENTIAIVDAVKDAVIQSSGAHGTVKLEKETYKIGETVTFEVEWDEHYEEVSVKVNNEDVTDVEGKYSFVAGITNSIVVAANPVEVVIGETAGHSTIVKEKESYRFGEIVNFKVVYAEDSLYEATQVSVGETVLTADTDGNYTFEITEEVMAITVAEQKKHISIADIAITENDSEVDFGEATSWEVGATATFTVTPDAFMKVVKVLINGEEASDVEGVYSIVLGLTGNSIVVTTDYNPVAPTISVETVDKEFKANEMNQAGMKLPVVTAVDCYGETVALTRTYKFNGAEATDPGYISDKTWVEGDYAIGEHEWTFSCKDPHDETKASSVTITLEVFKRLVNDGGDGECTVHNELSDDPYYTTVNKDNGIKAFHLGLSQNYYTEVVINGINDLTKNFGMGLAHISGENPNESSWLGDYINVYSSGDTEYVEHKYITGWNSVYNNTFFSDAFFSNRHEGAISTSDMILNSTSKSYTYAIARQGDLYYTFLNGKLLNVMYSDLFKGVDTLPGIWTKFVGVNLDSTNVNEQQAGKYSNFVFLSGSNATDKVNELCANKVYKFNANGEASVDTYDPVTNTLVQSHGSWDHQGFAFVNGLVGVSQYDRHIEYDMQLDKSSGTWNTLKKDHLNYDMANNHGIYGVVAVSTDAEGYFTRLQTLNYVDDSGVISGGSKNHGICGGNGTRSTVITTNDGKLHVDIYIHYINDAAGWRIDFVFTGSDGSYLEGGYTLVPGDNQQVLKDNAGIKHMFTANFGLNGGKVTYSNMNAEYITRQTDIRTELGETDIQFLQARTSYRIGDKVEFKLAPHEGHEIKEVKIGDTVLVAEDGVYSYVATSKDTIVVTEEAIEVSMDVEKEYATVTFDKETYHHGDDVTMTVEPSTGYFIAKVTLNGTEITGESGVYTFKAGLVNKVVVVTSNGASISKTIEHGKISFNNDSYEIGETVTFTVEMDNLYKINKVIVNGDEIFDIEGVYSFVALKDNSVTVTFEYDPIDPTIIVEGNIKEFSAREDNEGKLIMPDVYGEDCYGETLEATSTYKFNGETATDPGYSHTEQWTLGKYAVGTHEWTFTVKDTHDETKTATTTVKLTVYARLLGDGGDGHMTVNNELSSNPSITSDNTGCAVKSFFLDKSFYYYAEMNVESVENITAGNVGFIHSLGDKTTSLNNTGTKWVIDNFGYNNGVTQHKVSIDSWSDASEGVWESTSAWPCFGLNSESAEYKALNPDWKAGNNKIACARIGEEFYIFLNGYLYDIMIVPSYATTATTPGIFFNNPNLTKTKLSGFAFVIGEEAVKAKISTILAGSSVFTGARGEFVSCGDYLTLDKGHDFANGDDAKVLKTPNEDKYYYATALRSKYYLSNKGTAIDFDLSFDMDASGDFHWGKGYKFSTVFYSPNCATGGLVSDTASGKTASGFVLDMAYEGMGTRAGTNSYGNEVENTCVHNKRSEEINIDQFNAKFDKGRTTVFHFHIEINNGVFTYTISGLNSAGETVSSTFSHTSSTTSNLYYQAFTFTKGAVLTISNYKVSAL